MHFYMQVSMQTQVLLSTHAYTHDVQKIPMLDLQFYVNALSGNLPLILHTFAHFEHLFNEKTLVIKMPTLER